MKKVLLAFIAWRTILFFVAGFSPLLFPKFAPTFPYYQERLIDTNLPHFIWSFGNFDGVHYLGIAKDAYSAQFTQAFFPLYPILIKVFSFVFLGNLLISALFISNICFLAALIIFYKLVLAWKNEKTAFFSCLFLICFPTSFFFGSVYTESLFLLLTLLAFYFFEKGNILLASAFGAFSSLTRLIGIFLAPALAIKRKKISLLPLLIVPIGLLIYMAYLQIKFSQPFYFLSAQTAFGQSREASSLILLPQVFYRYFKILTTTSGLTLTSAIFELSSTIFALSILIIFHKKIKWEFLIFSLLAIITPTLTGTFASMPRYILIAFPIYIVLAEIKSDFYKYLLLVTFSIIGVFALSLFAQGYWVA